MLDQFINKAIAGGTLMGGIFYRCSMIPRVWATDRWGCLIIDINGTLQAVGLLQLRQQVDEHEGKDDVGPNPEVEERIRGDQRGQGPVNKILPNIAQTPLQESESTLSMAPVAPSSDSLAP